ncbi:type I restriction endonuclease EcoAI subunit S [Paracoccus acridae]|uniref:Type I restriction endonuclease EcoAI subunit S n=1 Tax=Paracoccus acridae TaxID=1795310 RepID=A0ABQ1VMC0_9RHOB|nr:restriction endonuclease subunit S [Paracoccus acridae]GGF76627.1 type I restriction endonuclease EcoAI subunit S [Paracoccus acridae]
MNAERLLTLYERVAEAPDAVPRLRRFVLDLAVRGKLVAQDASDEPASELLKRIAAEKARLVKAGEMKVRKLQARERSEPLDFTLPTGWGLTELGTVSMKITDGAHKTPTYVEKGVPFVSVKDFSGGKLDLSNTRFIPESEHQVLYQRCDARRGDILLGRIGTLGKAVLVDTDVEFSLFVSVGLIRFDHQNLLPEFFRLLLNSPFVEDEFDRIKIGGGTHTNKLNLGDLHTVALPLPPLAEQRRIVAKVEELMALLDRLETACTAREATRDRLTAASLARLTAPDADAADFPVNARFALATLPALTTRPDQIKPLRQTILNLAVRGKLVEQDPADEPASELLKRIAAAKADAKGRKGARAKGVPAEAETMNADFPTGWASVRLDNVAVSMRYGTSIKCDYDKRLVPVLRIPNVSSGQVVLDDMKHGPLSKADREALSLEADDLLLIRSNGSLDIVGRAAVVPPEAAGMAFAGYLVRLQTLRDAINSRYIWLALNSGAVREQIERPIRSAVGLKNVNLTEVGNLSFWLPPLAEQLRIVAKVDALMALCDRLEAALTTADTTRARLLEALLQEALAPPARTMAAAE